MRTWIVDWGKGSVDASRYALVQACDCKTEADVMLQLKELADFLNSNYDLTILEESLRVVLFEVEEDPEGLRYFELGESEARHGPGVADFFED